MSVNPPQNQNHYGVADTGTTGNYIAMDVPLQNEKPISKGPIVALPNNTTMQATHTGTLNIPQLPLKAKIACKFPSIKKSLISISDLCNEGGSATFTKHNVCIYFNGKIILKGFRDKVTGLWLLPLNANLN